MEGQYVPGGEPQKVRNRKPKPRHPTVDANNQASQGVVQAQPPPIRQSTLGAQPQPEVANWEGYNLGDEYGNAHLAQYYPEHHGYGGEHVDTHRYGYGSAHVDAGQEYMDYGGTHVAAGQHHDYGGTHVDAGQHYDHGGAHVDAGQGHGYGHDYDNGYGGAQADAGQDYGNGGTQGGQSHEYGSVAPTQQVKAKRSRNPLPVTDAVHPGEHHGGYENQHQQPGDGAYGHQPVPGGFAYPEAYNVVPAQQPNRNPPRQKRESKHRKGDRESALAARAFSREPDGEGSRSRTSQSEGSESNHSRSDRAAPPPAARPSLDEWMKKQAELAGPKPRQDESLIVFDDHDKSELETRMFGAPLATKQQPPIKLPPVVEPVVPPEATLQYQQPRGQPRENPLYQPAQRWPDANSSMPLAYRDETGAGGPSAKCMTCVHRVGVPVARLTTRCACLYCCTIL